MTNSENRSQLGHIIRRVIPLTLMLVFLLTGSLNAAEIQLSGKAEIGGELLDLTIDLSNSEKFMNKIVGYQTMTTGYDGKHFWRVENGAGPFDIDFSEKEIWVLVHWILSGYWLDEQAPITFGTDDNTGNVIFGLNEGRLQLTANVTLRELKKRANNDSRYFPRSIRVINFPQELDVKFVGEQTLNGLQLPEKILINGIGEIEVIEITSANTSDTRSGILFEKPAPQLDDVQFDPSVSPEVMIKQASTGHIFVRPTINGEQPGWFLFDSGAGGSMLSQELIDKFELEKVASIISGGIGGSTGYSDVYKGGHLTLGPLTISNLNYITYNSKRSMASGILGEPVVGVLGWDILTRAIVEVDMLKARLFIRDSDNYRIPVTHRYPLYLHWKVPYVTGRFAPGHVGIFMLDTGAGKHGIFFPNFSVKTFSLLEHNEGAESITQGAGGRVPVIKGTIDWFEVAGHTTKDAPAVFSIGEDHEADIFSTGFLGGAVIEPFRVVFDYRRNEVGFIPRE